jgi:hypothetical protein
MEPYRNRDWCWERVPPLSIEKILASGDAHRQRTGDWPGTYSGPIIDAQVHVWTSDTIRHPLAPGFTRT